MRKTRWALLTILSLGVAGYAAVVYTALPLGSLTHPDLRASFLAHPVGIYIHIFASIAALALGPFQFVTRLRESRPVLHRWMGRI